MRYARFAGMDASANLHPGIQVFVYQGYYPSVGDCAREYFYQFAMVHFIEELFQVQIDCVIIALCDVVPALGQCLVGIALWPEPVAVIAELWFIKRCECLGYGLLDNPVYYRGDAQLSLLPVVLGYLYLANRVGAVFARSMDLVSSSLFSTR